jgi:hypothetical protein
MRPTDIENHKMSNEDQLLWMAFERAKPRMCGPAAKQTIEAMEKHRRYRGYAHPSIHPFYVKIKGKGQINDPEYYYYPYLLVLQAVWPDSKHVQTIAKAFSKYWGVPDMWRGPDHYPMLNDRDREMKLFMGEKPSETEERDDESSAGNGEDNEEEEEYVKQEDEEQQEEEQAQEEQQHDEQEEEQEEDEEDTIPDISKIDAITDIDTLDELEAALENREKELMDQVQETKELIRKVQERKRDHFKEKSSASKKASEKLQKRLDAERRVSEHWATKEREYTEKLERSSATPSVISPPREQETERAAKRRRAAGSEN